MAVRAGPSENDTVISAIESGRSKLAARGRLIVRPSGTEPVVRVMAEGDDEELLKTVVANIAAALTRVAEKDSLADAA